MKSYEKIRKLREQNQWTQEDMAEKLGLSVTGYAKIETGKTHLTLQRLEQFAEIFNIDLLELIQHESHIFCQINEQSTNSKQGLFFNQYNEHYQATANAIEIDKLKLLLEHKEEIINQLNQQIQDLREINILLKAGQEKLND
ncbi:MAG: helix-turn-helix transcriptional regulator [Acinetobacter sp.]|nr:helix-turn-helix transcriptional regulator [Acinetobacter sp.]